MIRFALGCAALALVAAANVANAEEPNPSSKPYCVEHTKPVTLTGTLVRVYDRESRDWFLALAPDHLLCLNKSDGYPEMDDVRLVSFDRDGPGYNETELSTFVGKRVRIERAELYPGEFARFHTPVVVGLADSANVTAIRDVAESVPKAQPAASRGRVSRETLYVAALGEPPTAKPDAKGIYHLPGFPGTPDSSSTVEVQPDCIVIRRYRKGRTETHDFRYVSGRVEERVFPDSDGWFLVFGKGFWCSFEHGTRTCPEKIEVEKHGPYRDAQWKALTAVAKVCARKELRLVDVW